MNFVSSLMLSLSGGIIVGSVLMSMIGYKRSALSRTAASVFSGVGVGIGVVIFTYYGVSNGDMIGSILTGIIAAVFIGFASFIRNKRK